MHPSQNSQQLHTVALGVIIGISMPEEGLRHCGSAVEKKKDPANIGGNTWPKYELDK